MSYTVHIQKQLSAFKPQNLVEQAHADLFWSFLEEVRGNPFNRDNYEHGHITASALVVNKDRTKCVLLHHRKVGKWLQPGGHIEGKMSPLQTAQQEVLEETGLKTDVLSEKILTLGVHVYPEVTGKNPEHYHYDITYLLQADEAASLVQNHESNGVQWFMLDEAHQKGDDAIKWMVEKLKSQR